MINWKYGTFYMYLPHMYTVLFHYLRGSNYTFGVIGHGVRFVVKF